MPAGRANGAPGRWRLLRQLKGAPRSLIYRILRRGEVRVNKGRIKPEYRVRARNFSCRYGELDERRTAAALHLTC